MQRLRQEPQNRALLGRADVLVSLFQMFPFPVNYWQAQNIFYSMLKIEFPKFAGRNDPESRAWVERFLSLGEKLQVRVPVEQPEQPSELSIAS